MMSASYESDHYVRDSCYWAVFASTNDTKLCQFFLSNAKKQECLEVPATTPATIEGCGQLTSDTNKNACIQKIAISRKDYLICKEISDSNSKRTCLLAMVAFLDSGSEDSLCNEMQFTEDKDSCMAKLAETTATTFL